MAVTAWYPQAHVAEQANLLKPRAAITSRIYKEIAMASNNSKKAKYVTLGKVQALLACIDPHVDFDQFIEIAEAVYIETQGNVTGLKVLDTWARSGGDDNLSGELLKKFWMDFAEDGDRYFGLGKLMRLATQSKAHGNQPVAKH